MLRLKPATLAVCLLPLALVACGDPASTDDPRTQPPLVRAATVASAVDASRAFTGVVVARTQSDLGFRVYPDWRNVRRHHHYAGVPARYVHDLVQNPPQ